MFTGLVADLGTIERVRDTSAGRELRIRSSFTDLSDGESIAVDGVCLTVRERDDVSLTVAAAGPTLSRTTAGDMKEGNRVNLERAMLATDRFGGHIVQGHVDAVGEVKNVREDGDARLMDISIPGQLEALLVPHGSITVNGVSLTINALPSPGVFQVMLIEYTLRHTNLGLLAKGSRVNVEADVVGKYVQRLVSVHKAIPPDA